LANLLSVREAQQRILATFQPLPAVQTPLEQAIGCILAQDLLAANDLPLFDNSGMDGFAVRSADVQQATRQSAVTLKVVADIPAGTQPTVTLSADQAARIMTGAPLPAGADAVVPVEETGFSNEVQSPPPAEVQIFLAVRPGEYTRPRGQDVRAGQTVLRAGHRLRPRDLGLLASLGTARVAVHRRPQVALLSSGDELVAIDAPLEPGKIRDANSYILAAELEQRGWNVLRLGVARDELADVRRRLQIAVEHGVDLILTSAGVSVGAFDYVRSAIEEHGALNFWRVNMRPGKPVVFGDYHHIPLIGLPGNPVSAFVTFHVFVIPAINRLAGLPPDTRRLVRAHLAHKIESDGRESYLRATVTFQDGEWVASLTGHQGSGNLFALTQANALLIVPSGVKSLPVRETLDAWILDEF